VDEDELGYGLGSLENEDKVIARNVFEKSEFPDQYFKFWSYDDLQLDGNFSLMSLKVFVKVMELMEERHNK